MYFTLNVLYDTSNAEHQKFLNSESINWPIRPKVQYDPSLQLATGQGHNTTASDTSEAEGSYFGVGAKVVATVVAKDRVVAKDSTEKPHSDSTDNSRPDGAEARDGGADCITLPTPAVKSAVPLTGFVTALRNLGNRSTQSGMASPVTVCTRPEVRTSGRAPVSRSQNDRANEQQFLDSIS